MVEIDESQHVPAGLRIRKPKLLVVTNHSIIIGNFRKRNCLSGGTLNTQSLHTNGVQQLHDCSHCTDSRWTKSNPSMRDGWGVGVGAMIDTG